jgi:HAD superfamily hydrolase (TIGR01509 family)
MAANGIIFDFDGLIIDTEMPGCRAWAELFGKYGFSFTIENWKRTIGTGPTAYDPAQHLCQLTNGLLDKETIRKQTLARIHELIESQPLQPGVLEFIQKSWQSGLPLAVASSSNREWVEGYLAKLKLRHYFQFVCTSTDVKKVKPDPQLYLLATEKLGLKPDEVIAFEDSPNGIKAAKSAGIYCIAIPNEITQTMDLTMADRIVNSFSELDTEDLFDFGNER